MCGTWYSAWLTVGAQIFIILSAKKQRRERCSVSAQGIRSRGGRGGGGNLTPQCAWVSKTAGRLLCLRAKSN